MARTSPRSGRHGGHRPPAHAAGVRQGAEEHYARLVRVARHHADAGDLEMTLRSAWLAGTYGWQAPTGLLCDPELERLVVGTTRPSGRVEVDGTREGGHVLHVLTEAYATGGHTRLARRWVQRDTRRSQVALTRQRYPVPDDLQHAVEEQGSAIHRIDLQHPALVDRARSLRTLMDRSDVVVLHTHPDDTVVLAAAALPGPRPPIIYENHADHTYWLGLGATDLLCDLRPAASVLSRGLRGVPEARIAVLPLPLDPPHRATGGQQLRRSLGIPDDAVVALSVAADFKVAPTWGRGMDQVLERALRWSPRMVVVMAGVHATDQWARLRDRFPGRVLPVGPVADPLPFYGMADIYLESYPTRSVTSALEAGFHGLPSLSLTDIPDDSVAHLLQADSPGSEGSPRATSVEQYVLALRRLVDDAELRAAEGAAARARVEAAHTGTGWSERLEELYATARRMPAADLDEYPATPRDDEYGAFLVGYHPHLTTTPDPLDTGHRYGTPMNRELDADALIAVHGLHGRVVVRSRTSWESHRTWTTALLELAAAHPRLVLSLPFLPDDPTGSRTEELLVDLLGGAGLTTDDCGDVVVESAVSDDGGLVVREPAFDDDGLATVRALVLSPLWPVPDPGLHATSQPLVGSVSS